MGKYSWDHILCYKIFSFLKDCIVILYQSPNWLEIVAAFFRLLIGFVLFRTASRGYWLGRVNNNMDFISLDVWHLRLQCKQTLHNRWSFGFVVWGIPHLKLWRCCSFLTIGRYKIFGGSKKSYIWGIRFQRWRFELPKNNPRFSKYTNLNFPRFTWFCNQVPLLLVIYRFVF